MKDKMNQPTLSIAKLEERSDDVKVNLNTVNQLTGEYIKTFYFDYSDFTEMSKGRMDKLTYFLLSISISGSKFPISPDEMRFDDEEDINETECGLYISLGRFINQESFLQCERAIKIEAASNEITINDHVDYLNKMWIQHLEE